MQMQNLAISRDGPLPFLLKGNAVLCVTSYCKK